MLRVHYGGGAARGGACLASREGHAASPSPNHPPERASAVFHTAQLTCSPTGTACRALTSTTSSRFVGPPCTRAASAQALNASTPKRSGPAPLRSGGRKTTGARLEGGSVRAAGAARAAGTLTCPASPVLVAARPGTWSVWTRSAPPRPWRAPWAVVIPGVLRPGQQFKSLMPRTR